MTTYCHCGNPNCNREKLYQEIAERIQLQEYRERAELAERKLAILTEAIQEEWKKTQIQGG